MALTIHTNYSSLLTQTNLNKTNNALAVNQQRLGTGLRINSASDDAAGLQIATRLNAQTKGMAVAGRNVNDASSLLQTADGAFGEMTDILQRMKDLATQSANGTNSDDDRKAMQAEYDELGKELGNIMENTSYAGEKLFGLPERSCVPPIPGRPGTRPRPCALAALILTDQFPRNMFRDDPRAFATDPLARQIADRAIAAGFDRQIEPPARQFFYLPFEHSEDLADQHRCVELFLAHMPGENVGHAELHRDTIACFGRFPWRNDALGRAHTQAETRVMQAGGYAALVAGKLSLADVTQMI